MDLIVALNLQNSFLSPTGSVYMGDKAEILKTRLKDFFGSSIEKKIFIRETHSKQDTFFIMDKTHSIVTTEDHDIHRDFKKFVDLKDNKSRYNALYLTNLEQQLLKYKARHVTLVGLETQTSILFTSEGLRNRGYEVSVVEPCVMARQDYLHGCAIAIMQDFLGVHIVS